jgi:uncharacterized delta-60 repeat protein
LWTNRYNGPGNGWDLANAIAVDADGDIYVTGVSWGSSSNADYATIKYSSAGMPLWTNRYNGPEDSGDAATSIAVDTTGGVVVTGYSAGGVDSWPDFATINYSSAGLPLWTNRYNGPGNAYDQPNAVAVGAPGNAYVTGRSASNNSDPYNYDYATIAYSSAGGPLWTNHYNGPGDRDDEARGAAADANGNVYVTGYSWGGASFNDYATIGYSSAGTELWVNRYNGEENMDDQAQAVAVDASGNVAVTGWSWGGSHDYLTIKYSSAGVPLWTNRYDGLADLDIATAIALDASGNVYVTGYSIGTVEPDSDYATIKYSSAGVPLWTNRYNGPGERDDSASAVAVDAKGNVYVTGSSQGSGGVYDYATIAYSSVGVSLWTNRYNGPGDGEDRAVALAVDATGNVYVTGYSVGIGSSYDFATIKYAAAVLTPPVITTTVLAGTNLVFGGTGGTVGSTYYVLASSDMAAAVTNWSRVATNIFAADGSFSVTNTVNPAKGTQFFRLEVP